MAAVRAVCRLVERLLSPSGPLPALCAEQRTLARIVSEALDAPPRDGALVTLAQAATGTGKTVALLAPAMALAALQKKQHVHAHRAILSTFTNHLARQVLEVDAPRVGRALETLGYPRVSVALRLGQRQFIDHDRVERALARGRERDADALEALGAFDTFAEAEDHAVFVPAGLHPDALCVTPRTRAAAAGAFLAARRVATAADLVLTNHALVLTDCRLRGAVLGTGAHVPTLLFDEADALPEAARGIADERVDLAVLADTLAALGADATRPCRELARRCATATANGAHRVLAHCADRRAIIALVERLHAALEPPDAPHDEALVEEALLLRARLGSFLDGAHDAHAVAALVAGPAPALAVVHREPVRLLRHVFAHARAAFLVSATLAAPSARPHPNDLLRALGIAPGMRTPARLHFEGWTDLAPRRYGRMRFRFADRATPGPFRRDGDIPVADPRHLDYVARAIEAARTTGRVLVLCTSYPLAHELAARVPRAIAHRRGARLASCLGAFRAHPHAVLLTPAAWTGLSLPGLVDHLVIPRIPFPAHSVRDEARRHFLSQLSMPRSTAERLVAGDRNAAARRTLAQGIGRGIRGPHEHCTLWLLDPRFPLPRSMARVIGGPGQGAALRHLALIHCIPARFRNARHPAIDQGEIWPLDPPAP